MFVSVLVLAALLGRGILAQRPSNASLCDYYAISLYGSNTTATQFQLVQSILALAFAGGAGSGLNNVSSELTGIFNPGTVVNPSGVKIGVDLQPWFNGSLDSTNLNNQPVAINWFDAGGKAPLTAFLSGQTPNIVMPNSTNEYRLFNHWLQAFSFIFSCTLKPTLPATVGGQLNLAYVHKFMDLNQTDIGHFINQITLSSQHWGFSTQDASQLSLQLNARYNVRCSPAVGTQLFSLCQDETCPLAQNPDCGAYVNLGPSGVVSSGGASPTGSGAFTPSVVSSATSTPSTSTTSSTGSSQTSSSAPQSTPAAVLSPGAIAGVAIGGAAMLFAFIIVLIWMLRRRKIVTVESFQPSPLNPSFAQPAYTDPHTSYTGRSNNIVENWNGPTIAEMESPRFGSSPEMGQLNSQMLPRTDNRSPGPYGGSNGGHGDNLSPGPYGNSGRGENRSPGSY